MIRINLLDWREEQRQKRQQSFAIAVACSAAFGLGVVYLLNSYKNGQIDHQLARNNLIKQEITAVDKQIKEIQDLEKVKRDLLARMRIIEQLQQSRSRIVHFFDELLTTVPSGLYLDSAQQNGNKTLVAGNAESNGRVSTYIRQLDESAWFHEPRLIVIKAEKDNRRKVSEFKLEFQVKTPGAEEDDS